MHTVQPLPKWIGQNRPWETEDSIFKPVCELKGVVEGDVSPCSHFDHCERPAVIWIYHTEVWALCQVCYDWCYPAPNEWYRVVRIAPEFRGVL